MKISAGAHDNNTPLIFNSLQEGMKYIVFNFIFNLCLERAHFRTVKNNKIIFYIMSLLQLSVTEIIVSVYAYIYVRTQDHRWRDSNHQPIRARLPALYVNHSAKSDSQQPHTLQGFCDCDDS